jgi:hypothetical protein
VLDAEVLGGVVGAQRVEALGGVDYLLVEGAADLEDWQLDVVANLSSLHAAFALEGDGRLRPVTIAPLRRQDDDITTIQRYPGKTNEALTHLLVNLALAATADGFGRLLRGEPLTLLDPVCGRGTTLNRAVVYGLDAVGIEHDKRDLEAYEAFLLGWLKDKRLKHEVERAQLRKGRATPVRRTTVRYWPKDQRDRTRVLELLVEDTTQVRSHLKARAAGLLAADLPYGVQHGSTPAPGALRRDPGELLAAALPGWIDVLAPGGGVALSWNRRTLDRPAMVAALTGADLELVTPADDERFVHRVDRSITRDVAVARRPR